MLFKGRGGVIIMAATETNIINLVVNILFDVESQDGNKTEAGESDVERIISQADDAIISLVDASPLMSSEAIESSVSEEGIDDTVAGGSVCIARTTGAFYSVTHSEGRFAIRVEGEVECFVEEGVLIALLKNFVLHVAEDWEGDGPVESGVIGLNVVLVTTELII